MRSTGEQATTREESGLHEDALAASRPADPRGAVAGGQVVGPSHPTLLLRRLPVAGQDWVSTLGPYNEHLVRDVGALNLALGVLLATAALLLERRLVQVSLIAYLVYAVPHFAFHLVKGNALPRRQRREHGHAGDRGPTPARSSCSWPFAQRRAKATSHRRLSEDEIPVSAGQALWRRRGG
jgi:hypothetical protein